MLDDGKKIEWRVMGQSVRGASHVRAGLPNQDAIRWLPESGTGPPLVLVVSDGHGSAKSFRSDVGACLVVETATQVLEEFVRSLTKFPHLSAIKRWAEENLPREIVRRWRERVANYVSENPFTSAELDQLEAKRSAETRRQVSLEPVLAYGATLLVVLTAESFILYLQLGDGDILIVSDTGEVDGPPIPGDERLFANETTSLSSRHAWRDFRAHFQVVSGTLPALILVATDGYANSFRDDASFLQVGTDILEMIRTSGPDATNEQMGAWLSEASQKGSGDDITLGILYRADVLTTPAEHVPVEQRSSISIAAQHGNHVVTCPTCGSDVEMQPDREPKRKSRQLREFFSSWRESKNVSDS